MSANVVNSTKHVLPDAHPPLFVLHSVAKLISQLVPEKPDAQLHTMLVGVICRQTPLLRQVVDEQVVDEVVVAVPPVVVCRLTVVGEPVVVGATMEQVDPLKPATHWQL